MRAIFCQRPGAARPGLLGCLLLWLTLGSLAFAAAGQDQPPQRVAYKQTVDAEGKEVTLYLHVFMPEGWKAEDQRPAIVFFFGGGWVSGSPSQFYPHCRELAARGMVAVSAEYRVRNTHGTPPQACVADGKSAVRYLRQHAAELGIDPAKIAAGGGSAGGHVAASTALVSGFEEEGEDKDISSVPNLLVLFNPVIDTSPRDGYGASRLGEDAEKLSPIRGVHADQPASVIFHGRADSTVPVESVIRFREACRRAGAECVLHTYEGAEHGFFNHSAFRKPKPDAPNYYELTMQQTVAFLAEHGYVEPAAGEGE